MRFSRQFWRIFIGSILLAWIAATFLPAFLNVFEGFWLTIKPEFSPGSEAFAKLDLATSTLAAAISFWAFVIILGLGIIFGIVITSYEWFKYKRLPLFLYDKFDRLKLDIDKRFHQIDQDIREIKKQQKSKKSKKG